MGIRKKILKKYFAEIENSSIFALAITEDPWCNGSTPVFGTVCRGSNPCGSTEIKSSSQCGELFLFLINLILLRENILRFDTDIQFFILKFCYFISLIL